MLQALRNDAAAPRAQQHLQGLDAIGEADEGRWCCARCGAEITAEAAAIAVQGSHAHACVNPAGISFRVLCFRAAPGCSCRGTPTDAATFFTPYSWNHAHCARCAAHLGWVYHAPGGASAAFHGLIADRLCRPRAQPRGGT